MNSKEMRANFRLQLNDMSVDKHTRDTIKFLLESSPQEGFLRQILNEISSVQSDHVAISTYLYGVKKLIENRDSRVLDQKSSSEAFNRLINTTLAVSIFYETIPLFELLKGVYHHYNLSRYGNV